MTKFIPQKNFFKKQNAYLIAYCIIGILFLIWMLFLDSHSLIIHQELDDEIEKLMERKTDLLQSISEDKSTIKQLGNIDSLEKFARENYGHKKEGETIFIIDEKTTLQSKNP